MDNKISVIIPTLQKELEGLQKSIKQLQEDSSVTEILIINNLPQTPLQFKNNDKVQIITPKENLYVNASWNLGIEQIKNENFVILNDDMVPCKDFCFNVVNSPIFNNSNTGFIGMGHFAINFVLPEETLKAPQETYSDVKYLELEKFLAIGDWGISIFGKKCNWYTIPDTIKILFGDNYLLYKAQQDGKINYQITNLRVSHKHSTTSTLPQFNNIIVKDIHFAETYFPNYPGVL